MPTIRKENPNDSKPTKARTGGVFDRIVDVADAARDEGIKVAIFGRSGSGKTTLLSTFPKPMFIAICSNSAAGETLSITNVPGIKVVDLQSDEELKELVEDQRQNNRYKTFALDHVSAFSDLSMRHILGRNDRTTPKTGDHQENNLTLKTRLADMLNLKCNVVINAQEREFNTGEENNANEMLMPNVSFGLTPGVKDWLGPAVDYVLYTFRRMGYKKTGKKVKIKIGSTEKETDETVEAVEFCLRTGAHPVISTKFRAPRGVIIPDVISDPTYDKILALIKGKV